MKPTFLIRKILLLPICGLLVLTAPLAAVAQQTVFNDTFGTSTVGLISTPGGTPTASSTSYDQATPKGVSSLASVGTRTTSGHLYLGMLSTSSANDEFQAVFTTHPVTLAVAGDNVDIQYSFTDTTNILNGLASNGNGLALGLYNSGGSAPSTNLFNNGLTTATTLANGFVQNWLGYRVNFVYNPGAAQTSSTSTRPAQNQGNQLNQALNAGFTGGVGLGQNSQTIAPLIVGNQYTVDFNITLQANGSLAFTNKLYAGVGTGGTVLATNIATASGANILTTNFDGLVLGGSRNQSPAAATTNDVNQIIVTFTSTNQAGPYFTLTSTGSGCGGATLGLDGSVTTNNYLLYTNGVFNGQSVAGSGSAITFGAQTAAAVYTIYASNLVTASVGPMYGSQTISQTAPVITSQPADVSCVSNAPASFTVAATGNTLTYQWYKNGIALTNGGDFSGVTTTNLVVSPAQAADAATTVNGYYVVVQDPCGDSVTSAPNAALTLLAPNNLVWQGGNPNNTWDLTATLNFTNPAGAFEAFTNGDNVTFDDTSANPTVIISNSLVPTLVTVTGTHSYLFGGAGSITGFGKLLDINTGTLTITNNNLTYTGGTIVSNGATLALGNGASASGSIAGSITVNTNSVLHYYYNNNANIANKYAGNGTVIYDISTGNHTYTIPTATINTNFVGTNVIDVGVQLHCSDNNLGYPLGNGGVVIVNNYGQAWLDRSAASYNQTFIITGVGWFGDATTQLGALKIFGCTISGPVILAADARIGGTINGGTISGQISGNHQLEVLGNTNSFILSVGSANGPNTYGNTLVTSGAIRALTASGISTNILYDDLLGEVDVYGNNVSVNGLNDGPNGAGVVYNMGTTTNGTLTVGLDGSSSTFHGVFGNGASQSLGLTKVGAGALTLSGVSTNTGTVAVQAGQIIQSGSFNNASVIAVGSGATYDVSGASGSTLTLNSGQTLMGSGTINGSVSTSAGSVVNPGDGIGALTITGNATLAGGLTMELNRTNSTATNDALMVTGTLTAGGTLTVKNLGPALHVGDTFYLFAGAVTTGGFSATNLPVTDANGYAYTWINNIGVDGSIQVLTAGPAIANYLFRSVVNGNWSDTSTWQQSSNGVNWVAAIGTPDYTSSNIVIQTGTTVTNLLAVMVDRVTVQTSATVLLTTGNLIVTNSTAAIDLLVGGNLVVGTGGGLVNMANSATLVFTNGGAYVWNNAVIPTIPTAAWQDGSTCRISAMATGLVSGISGQSFYDFIWDTTAAGQSTRGRLNITGASTAVRRDFTVTIPDTAGASMTINNDTNGILTVGRNVVLTGGITSSGTKILLNNAGGQTNLFKVGGNFTVAGYIDGFGSTLTTFEFNGAGMQSLTLPASTFLITASAMNWLVDSGSTVALASSVQAFNNFTNNGTLTFGVNTISGGGAVVFNSGSKVNGNGTNNLVSGVSSLVNGGTLNLTNSVSLPTFAGGESFSLFSASFYSGTFGTLLPATPDVTHTWVTTQLNTAGILAVSGGVNTNAPQVQVSIASNVLSLAWPTNKGWTLLTNSAGLTAASQWFPYPNSANLTNVNITMDPSKTNVFFRMVYPYP